MSNTLRTLRLLSACLTAGVLVLSTAIPSLSQGATQPFRYVIPRFRSTPGSELIISNLSSRLVTPEITLGDPSLPLSDIFLPIPAGSQQRFTAASFGLSGFDGPVLIDSAAALSVVATVVDAAGNFETLQPATGSATLVIPFGPGTSGNMDVTIFNSQASPTTTLISAVAADGSTVGTVQRIIPAFGRITENVASLVPQAGFSQSREISHFVIRALTNIFGGDRLLYAQAAITGFSASPEGLIGQHFDPGVVTGITVADAVTKATVPFFVQGGDYITMLQMINTSGASASVRLTALAVDGSAIAGTNPTTVSIPANGSVRRNIQNIFNFAGGINIGSITIDSSTPVMVTAALASSADNGFVLMPGTEPSNTNFAFRTRTADPQFYTGFAFRNPNPSAALLTLVNIPDDGSGASSQTLSVGPFALASHSLLELLAEARTAGFVYVFSNVPIFAQGIEGQSNNRMLANLPAMHSQPDYVPPGATKFLITGAVRHNGSPLSAVSVQLSGSRAASTLTDDAGNYQFENVGPGQYTVRAAKTGYTFASSSLGVTITAASKRDNDFSGTLVTPAITAVVPTGVLSGSPATDIFVAGGPIIATSEILFDGLPVITSVTSAGVPVTVVGATGGVSVVVQQQTVLKAVLGPELLATPRSATVVIRNSGPGGSVSSTAQTFGVGSPAPAITGVSGVPNPLIAGNSGFTMTVSGTGFAAGTVVVFDGTPLVTTFVSESQLVALVPASALTQPGVCKVTALKLPPTIGPSNELAVVVASPIPEVTSISPNVAEARLNETAPPIAVTVRGFNFLKQSVVQIDGIGVPTDYHSGTELVGNIPQPQLEIARSALISVKNPDPVRAEFHFDSRVPFVLYNPVPTVTSVDASMLLYDPTPRFEGDDPLFPAQIAIRGTNFAKDQSLRYLTATPCIDKTGLLSGERVSSTLIIGRITIACTGLYSFGAANLQPGGGVSPNLISFTVSAYTAPAPLVVAGLAPAAVVAGSPTFTMTISGSNFSAGAVVNFGTAVLLPISVTGNTMVVTIPSFLVSTSGVVPVSVTNPNLTGNSNRILFTIN